MAEETSSETKPQYSKCVAICKDLAPCEAAGKYADHMCLFHSQDPVAIEIRAAAKVAGGRAPKRTPGSASELALLMWHNIQRISGSIEPEQMQQMAPYIRTYLMALTVAKGEAVSTEELRADMGELSPSERAVFFELARKVIKRVPIEHAAP